MDATRLKRQIHPMPEDVKTRLENENLMAAYLSRPPYQQNDYIGWIGRAKLAATREKRIAQGHHGLPGSEAGGGAAPPRRAGEPDGRRAAHDG